MSVSFNVCSFVVVLVYRSRTSVWSLFRWCFVLVACLNYFSIFLSPPSLSLYPNLSIDTRVRVYFCAHNHRLPRVACLILYTNTPYFHIYWIERKKNWNSCDLCMCEISSLSRALIAKKKSIEYEVAPSDRLDSRKIKCDRKDRRQRWKKMNVYLNSMLQSDNVTINDVCMCVCAQAEETW